MMNKKASEIIKETCCGALLEGSRADLIAEVERLEAVEAEFKKLKDED